MSGYEFFLLAASVLPLSGITLPSGFERNEQLSVAGQTVYQHINDNGERDLVAVTPALRPRSLELLRNNGYETHCQPGHAALDFALVRRHAGSTSWLLVQDQRVLHIVVADRSNNLGHFRQQVAALCSPPDAGDQE
ncbi:MAG: hypothetical protein R3217_06880 [Gammaproteobacteria bacterium]|nr:hypothetical protein [Gammaproteobacteria bacterium]